MSFLKEILTFVGELVFFIIVLLICSGKEDAAKKHGWDIDTMKHGDACCVISVIIGAIVSYIISESKISNNNLLIISQAFATIISYFILNKTGV